MNIVYGNKISKADVIKKLEQACFYRYGGGKRRSVIVFRENDSFFLEITTGRVETRYKVVIFDDHICLKYHGWCSFMNLLMVGFFVGIPAVVSIFMVILALITRNFEGISAFLMMIPVVIPCLWLFLIRHRRMADKYLKKILAL